MPVWLYTMFKKLPVLLLLPMCSLAQQTEFDAFATRFYTFQEYANGRLVGMEQNAKNYNLYVDSMDQAFRSFALTDSSAFIPGFVQASNASNLRFRNMNNKGEVQVRTFNRGTDSMLVYSYSCRDHQEFFVKEVASGKVVYVGKERGAMVKGIYKMDSALLLMILETGEMLYSREVIVLQRYPSSKTTSGKSASASTGMWKKIKAFEGAAFGQVPGDFRQKKVAPRRERFIHEADMDLAAPHGAEEVFFDPSTKTLSYKKFSDERKFVWVKAVWKNNCFTMDDYSLSEDFSSSGVVVPE
jgi:hypothetical protein